MGIVLAKQPTSVADEAAMLALEDTLPGDEVLRRDDGHAYKLMREPSWLASSWRKLDDSNEAATTVASDVRASDVGLWGTQRKPLRVPALGSVLTSFASGHGWSGGLDDSNEYRLGSQSLKLTAALHASVLTYLTSPVLSPINLLTSCIELMLKVEAGVAKVTVEVSSDAGATWVQTEPIMGLRQLAPDRWVTPRLNKGSFAVNGAVSFTAINRIRVGARTPTSASSAKRVWLQRLGLYAATEAKASLTICVGSYSRGVPIMDEFIKRAIRPTLADRPLNAISTSAGSMSIAQLEELHHTFGFGVTPIQWSNAEVDTANYVVSNGVEYESGLLRCLWFYKKYGFERPAMWFADMSSAVNAGDQVVALARRYFECSILDVVNETPLAVNVYPLQDPYAMTGLFMYTRPTMTSEYISYIDRVVESKSHGNIFIVNMDETSAGAIIARSDVAALLDYVQSKGSAVEVLTANEFAKARL